jgi:hypothetical protein
LKGETLMPNADLYQGFSPAEGYCALADLYLSHPNFVARYERIERGFAEYLARAMRLHARKWGDPAEGLAANP